MVLLYFICASKNDKKKNDKKKNDKKKNEEKKKKRSVNQHSAEKKFLKNSYLIYLQKRKSKSKVYKRATNRSSRSDGKKKGNKNVNHRQNFPT